MATPQVTSRILRRLLASGVTGRAERLLGRMAPSDVALLLPELTPDEIRAVIELLFRQRRAALALRELPNEMLPHVFEALADSIGKALQTVNQTLGQAVEKTEKRTEAKTAPQQIEVVVDEEEPAEVKES